MKLVKILIFSTVFVLYLIYLLHHQKHIIIFIFLIQKYIIHDNIYSKTNNINIIIELYTNHNCTSFTYIQFDNPTKKKNNKK